MKHNGEFLILMKLSLLSYKCFNRSLKILITQFIHHLRRGRFLLLHSPPQFRLRPPQLPLAIITASLSPEIRRSAPPVSPNSSDLKNRLLVLVYDLLRSGEIGAAGDEILAEIDVDFAMIVKLQEEAARFVEEDQDDGIAEEEDEEMADDDVHEPPEILAGDPDGERKPS